MRHPSALVRTSFEKRNSSAYLGPGAHRAVDLDTATVGLGNRAAQVESEPYAAATALPFV